MKRPPITKEQAGRVLLEALGAHAGSIGGGASTIKSAVGAGGAVPSGSALAEVMAGRAAPPPAPEPIRRVPGPELDQLVTDLADKRVREALAALGIDPAKVKP